MFDCQDLPADNEDIVHVVIDLPFLADDSPGSSPVAVDRLLGYLSLQAPGGGLLTVADLNFRRTADLRVARYWIWSFVEPDGRAGAYATVRQDSDGTITMGYDTNDYRLSPEQFIVGEHCGCW